MKNPLRNSFRKKPSEIKKNDSEKDADESPVAGYARYTNIIYQLIGTIAFAFAVGYFIDKLLHLTFPVFKIIFSFGGVILALYLVFKQLNRK